MRMSPGLAFVRSSRSEAQVRDQDFLKDGGKQPRRDNAKETVIRMSQGSTVINGTLRCAFGVAGGFADAGCTTPPVYSLACEVKGD